MGKMSRSVAAVRPARKPRDAYHHGHLRQALVDQAVATIRDRGVEALTLRDVGEKLRVSRTALYRHFADKDALLEAVATEGFRAFRQALADAWNDAGRGHAGFMQMGRAYITFARTQPSHYRAMFGAFGRKAGCDPELRGTAASAFAVLVDALADLQGQGLIRTGPPEEIAVFVWSCVHGFAALAIDGQLPDHGPSLDGMTETVIHRVWDGLAAAAV